MVERKLVTEARQRHGDREPDKSQRERTNHLLPRETQAPSTDLESGLQQAIVERRD